MRKYVFGDQFRLIDWKASARTQKLIVKEYESERVRTLKDITARNTSREIEGCKSWRHFAVHQDRMWLLNAIEKIREQVEKVHQAEKNSETGNDLNTELHALLNMFEEERLNHIGSEVTDS